MNRIVHIKSTEQACWQESTVGPAGETAGLQITQRRKQSILGFGGCFNELGWDALQKAEPSAQKAFLDDLFGKSGCNFNFGRVPIGANDFSLEWYSCDEVKDDYALEHFSIQRDQQYTLPFVKEAMARRSGKLPLFASPWSPPTWMKTKPVYNFGTLRMEEKILCAYADYFVRFVKAYAEEGVTVEQVHVQNEPMADQKFPSCKWTGPDMRDFIKGYLGPAFRESGLPTELWLGTINGPFQDMMFGGSSPFSEFYDQFVNTVLSDDQARNYLAGVGLQWGGKHILEQVEAAWPDLRLMQTESECGDGNNSWTHMEYIAGLMWQYFRHGAERYTYWNMALCEDGESSWGWRQNSLCTVDPADGKLALRPEFYLMKHYSHFVQPGARFAEVTGRFAANATAFENPDGSLAVIIASNMDAPRKLDLAWGEKGLSAQIDPHSVHSFLIP